MAARGPSKQFKFSVPESDERLISWLESQQNLSVSMSWLIKAFINSSGGLLVDIHDNPNVCCFNMQNMVTPQVQQMQIQSQQVSKPLTVEQQTPEQSIVNQQVSEQSIDNQSVNETQNVSQTVSVNNTGKSLENKQVDLKHQMASASNAILSMLN